MPNCTVAPPGMDRLTPPRPLVPIRCRKYYERPRGWHDTHQTSHRKRVAASGSIGQAPVRKMCRPKRLLCDRRAT
ncbi:unnamed protein product [Leptosia nina]|uniref:Uncharacterized protein n=1 Tax=Leptosia nina TaxID=320188 RepID=A0AAV1JCL8_9NEOP